MPNVPSLFDHRLLAMRRQRALARPEDMMDAGFLYHAAAEDLAERVAAVSRAFKRALVLDPPNGALADALAGTDQVEMAASSPGFASANIDHPLSDQNMPLGDVPATGTLYDLIASILSLQFANDLPGVLIQIRRALKPDGLFLGSLLGGDTLIELREVLLEAEAQVLGGASPRVLPFGEVRDLGSLLQRAGFALPVTDMDTITVRYSNPHRLLTDLRAVGATNIFKTSAGRPLRKDVLARAMALYQERFAEDDGKVPATFQIISLSGWAPHDSQQKPLKPGSAKTRLADALGVSELPTGDKAGG